ncbi:MAG: BamA/TamA family outer membrane protein [Ignavibacteriaceae bacterium]|nr:BamA/TamA family outer membrane protein [Ignavibacteriaceae bacterium]
MSSSVKIFFLILIIYLPLKAQQEDTLYYEGNYSVLVDSIKVSGNVITEEIIILRELTFGIGDTLNQELALYNRERIYSLDIFNVVKLKPAIIDDKNILIIEVEESWYIYPIPFVTLRDKDWEKISYGVAVSLKNFRGRNEKLKGVVSLGYDPSFSFSYLNPNLAYKLDLFLTTILGFRTSTNNSTAAEELHGENFEQKIYFGRVTFGKRFGLYHRFALKTGYDYVETPFYIKGVNASSSRIDRTLMFGAYYSYDTRDLAHYPSSGIFAFVSYEFKGFGINNINYRVSDFDFREYRKFFKKLTAKWRFAIRHTEGSTVPFYDYSYLGFSERVRGYFHSSEREGNDRIIGSVELNYPLIEETRLNLYFIPFLPKSLLSYRVALISELFVDTGTTRLQGEPLSIKNFDTGYGGGLSVLFLPYFVMRLELAFNDHGKSEWIFDIGASF